ncbi:hypothetical protein BDN72DRAFT_454175 [Pluteus cervinus]|uniref:Uncharacterized protein n=1 Tax=Pluteus cervinus TaxID=181527 RepID=A0ACD3BDM2_9AGAR|nr:hypothetical protein BDN72DRAFT_454175 [Pluteus cervinus]
MSPCRFSYRALLIMLFFLMPGSASMQMPGCFVEQTPCQEPTNGPPTFFGSPIGTSTPPRSRSDFSTHSPSSDGDSFMEFNITDEAYPTVDRDQDSNGQQKDTQETGIPPGSSSTQGFPSHVHIAGGMYRRTRIQTTDGLFDATEWSFWTFPDGTNAPAADTVSLCSDDTGIDDLVSSPPSPENRGYEEQSIWPEREAPPHISECSGQVAAVDTTSPDVSMPNLKDDTPAPVGVDFTQSDDISTERESPTGPEGNEQAYEDEDEVEASGFDYSDLPPVTPSKALSQPMIAIVSALHRAREIFIEI